MTARRFSTSVRFTWQGQTFEIRQLLPGSRINIALVDTGEMQTVGFADLFRALARNELAFTDQKPNRAAENPTIDWSDIPEAYRHIAAYRLEVIRPLLTIASDKRKEAVRQRVQEVQAEQTAAAKSLLTAVSEASIYRWLRYYEQSGQDIRALLPNLKKRGNRNKSRINEEVNQIIETTINDLYYLRERRTVNYILREVRLRTDEENRYRTPEEQLPEASRPTVARRIAARDKKGVLIAKRGRREADRETRQYGQMSYPDLPEARVEIDHTQPDIIIVDEEDMLPYGRLTLTYCLDTFARYPLGFYLGFEPPSYLTVMECLYHAILPKGDVREQYQTEHEWLAYGIPYTLFVDNGPEFIGRDLDDACMLLGINLHRAPARTPEFKAAVERMFGTLNTGLLHTLLGTTFSNIWQRGDYNSLKTACISLERLTQILHIHLLDIYAEEFHKGIQAIPARQWEGLTQNGFFPRVPQSADELSILLGHNFHRVIQGYGIEHRALRYNSPALALLRSELEKKHIREVKCKIHPGDISRIYVHDPFANCYIEAPALAQEYTNGLSLWKHEVILNFARKNSSEVNLVALGQAQRKIREIVEASLNDGKRRTRRKEARWQHGGQTPSLAGASAQAVADGETTGQETMADDEFNFNLEELKAEGWGVLTSGYPIKEGKANE